MSKTESFGDMVAIRDVAEKYISTLGEKNDKYERDLDIDMFGLEELKGMTMFSFIEEFSNASCLSIE